MDEVDDFLVVHLDAIDKRLLECGLNRDDGVHGPLASLARRPGSCTAITARAARPRVDEVRIGASNGINCERVVAIFGQFVWALREPRRLSRGRA